jgi:hypothetical protein
VFRPSTASGGGSIKDVDTSKDVDTRDKRGLDALKILYRRTAYFAGTINE